MKIPFHLVKLVATFTIGIFVSLSLIAQNESFTVQISTDSILIGNVIQIQYSIDNIQGEFQQPSFEGFEVVSGPALSTSMSIINGETKSSKSYTFVIKPLREGMTFIDPGYLVSESQTIETQPLEVFTYPNPENIIQSSTLPSTSSHFNFNFNDSFGKMDSIGGGNPFMFDLQSPFDDLNDLFKDNQQEMQEETIPSGKQKRKLKRI